ncbi:MAG TPA: ATP-binding cassette domain-containing protein [Deinococcales bacterium]|nr:ATP-binding cassette domain-containing protein [Deinococcales bacterium]
MNEVSLITQHPAPAARPAPPAPGRSGDEVARVTGLEKRYGPKHAVRNVNLSVHRGEVYGFLGPNGAGKTTTIRALLGLIRPTAGRVTLFGEPRNPRSAARVGALVESPSAYAHLTARENLEVTRRMIAAPRAQIPEMLDLVGLSADADRPVRGFSLGMKGRLGLALALLGKPELLILDEPTNGLDPAGIREVRDLIRTLPERGVTVMVSSHLLAEVELMATHVGIINAGATVFEGPLEALRAHAVPRLTIAAEPVAEARAVLSRLGLKASLTPDGLLELPAAGVDAARLNAALVQAGIRVSRLEPGRASLEELFLDLTEHAQAQA